MASYRMPKYGEFKMRENEITKLVDVADRRRRSSAQFEQTIETVQETKRREALRGETVERLTAAAWLASALGEDRIAAALSTELVEDSAPDVLNYLLQDIGTAMGLVEDDCGINGDGSSTFAGMLGIAPRLLNGSSAGKVAAVSTHKTFATIDNVDMAALMAALPDRYWGPNGKFYISAFGYATGLARLGSVAGGTLWDGDAATVQPLWNGFPCILTPKMPNTSADLSGKIMILFGDMSKVVAVGSRREIALATSLHRYLDNDQLAYRIIERFDVVPHNLGDATNAGALVGLQGTT